ncbi:unnamed protein product [Penicillium nalgiovense]|uniref:Uncharacterized protein n=1 Tax=Penicillium nalgiovense TaxID=60175 RepID=A0A1V6YT90_PENNA|nr:hypothetical protein PENNAL_c0011G03824 [Penicillium nalgiovense]CAG7966020.1 unnamed protein product [Penicillium nalgiovense]CAG8050206.1 unnamed protein product [Penicillium nalgiovense]CAG8073014.1 unnamed protein product [Penicillium nalgiovense]CAG8102124.1 unnamed protein product [Penicillium nalgiovense]
MAESPVHGISDQLKRLTAQSPAARNPSHVSAARVDATEPIIQGSVLNAPEGTDSQVPASTESDLTDIDESLLQDPSDPAPMPQSALTETHFISPTAPRVSYQVSASGEVMITEGTETPKPIAPAPAPRPSPPAYLSFDRLAQGLPPKLASSPTSPKIQPPSLAVERIIGPKQPIPARILELLEEWHEDSPYTEHPSALSGRAPSTWKHFKAFSDDGDECELSIFQISLKGQTRRSLTYRIMILHSQNGPEELVVYGQPRPKFRGPLSKGTRGLYLLDWLEIERKGEVQACGLKLWRTDEQKITFSAHMFDCGRKCTRLPGPNDIFNMRASSSTPKKQSGANEDIEDAGSNSSEPPYSPSRSRRQVSTSSHTKPENEEDRAPVASRPSSAKTISTEIHSLASPWKPQKRRRGTWSSNDETYAVLRYKLTSDASDQVRVFKTNDAKVLFEKAQQFYKGIEKRTGLLCTVSGVEGVRYVGEGCVDEFDILQEDIRKSSGPGDEDRVVEVKPAMGF